MGIYITSQGDTWDIISYKVYGSEKYIGLLMQNNFKLLDIFQFSSGVEVYIPEIAEDNVQNLPDWR